MRGMQDREAGRSRGCGVVGLGGRGVAGSWGWGRGAARSWGESFHACFVTATRYGRGGLGNPTNNRSTPLLRCFHSTWSCCNSDGVAFGRAGGSDAQSGSVNMSAWPTKSMDTVETLFHTGPFGGKGT